MANLAPFVAAVLKDKTVSELQQELEEKNRLLKSFYKVEITGKNGTPVYARAQFEEGQLGEGLLESNEWRLSLKHVRNCPLRDLRLIEVRVGGVVTFRPDPAFLGYDPGVILLGFVGAEYNNAGRKDIKISSCVGDHFWLHAMVYGWKQEDWRPLLDDDDWEDGARELFDHFKSLPYVDNCHVEFDKLALFKQHYSQWIEQVTRSASAKQASDGDRDAAVSKKPRIDK